MNKATVLILVLCFLLVAPALTEAQNARPFGEWFERSLGSSAVPELIKQYGGVYIVPIHERLWLDEVFGRLVEKTERTELDYSLIVLDSSEYNAFALPGGYLFITRGLLKAIGRDEAKLAAVLGHEIAHVEKKHGVNAVLRQMGLAVVIEVGALWLDVLPADLLRVASATLLQLLQLGWGREAEYEADALGQAIAVAAGFDGIGAISLLEDLLEADSDDLPMKVFRTHPDTKNRRQRVEENLVTFWSVPQRVPLFKHEEIFEMGRIYDQNGRSDPNNRYDLKFTDDLALAVYDTQREQTVEWLEGVEVLDFQWSPKGNCLAVLILQNNRTELRFIDRFGHVIKKPKLGHLGEIKKIVWSPEGQMLALELTHEGQTEILVTYFETEVYIPVSGDGGGKDPIWLQDGLYFTRNQELFITNSPVVQPVVVLSPLPVVLRRQKVLSPTVIREGDTIRLTRPSLALP